jgi:pyridoxamine 5'-phosphate oxidase
MDMEMLPNDPIELFHEWFDAASGGEDEANAMAVATVGRDGMPSNRFVLLKGADEHGFVFFTYYRSRKAKELEADPRVAATIFWPDPPRQVRIEGMAERVSEAESDAYFATRDRRSQIGAVVSPQSEVIGSREELDDSVAGYSRRMEGGRFRGRTTGVVFGSYLLPSSSGRVGRTGSMIGFGIGSRRASGWSIVWRRNRGA